MQINDIVSKMAYSHRPRTGVSVGAFQHEGQLYIAAALVNDGMSNACLFHRNRQDSFSRPTARQRIAYRIDGMIAGKEVKNGIVLRTGVGARQFIQLFRKSFKPCIDESDDTFMEVSDMFGVEIRNRMRGDKIWTKIQALILKLSQGQYVSTSV